MKHRFLPILGLICLASCSNNEDDTYPSIITEMADLYTNDDGKMEKFTTDAGITYQITNGKGDLKPRHFDFFPFFNAFGCYEKPTFYY